MVDARRVRNFYVLSCLLALAACSNGRGSLDSEEPPSGGAQEGFTVGGTITGLQGNGLVLQNNGANDLAVSNDGTFTFNGQLANAAAYGVTVVTQPSNPSQTCTVGSGTGTIAAANVTNVTITCATGAFALRVTVSGLLGTGLVLQNNGGDDLPIAADGEFGFSQPIASGAAYSVTVLTPPSGPSQSCTVTSASGTVGAADVNLAVNCATGSFSVGGTVSGLVGSGLQLQNNGGAPFAISGNGPFQLGDLFASGATYDVAVAVQPTSPTQNCGITNNSGTVGNVSVTNIAVSCMTDMFTIGGTIAGLDGSGLRLRLNSQPPIDVLASASSFTFPPPLIASGTAFTVEVTRSPSNPAQDCSVSPATGVVAGENVTNLVVTCTTRKFRIGGTVSGLRGDGLRLRNSDGETLTIASSGSFLFSHEHLSGSSFAVIVDQQPTDPSQTCTVANGSGKVGSGDVNVAVTCDTNTFKVGGSVFGLLGGGLELTNNGGDAIEVAADGSFEFPRELASGANFNVQVRTHPSNPTQVCDIGESGQGSVADRDVTTVVVNCSTSNFTIGGTASGLAGVGLRLQNNGGDDLDVPSDGGFTFGTGIPSGAQYNVTVAVQPGSPAQQCDVAQGSGTVVDGPVTSVQVSCVTTEFSIGGTITGLRAGGLVLQNNGADSLAIANPTDTTFKFPTSLPNGTPYSVTVIGQPSGQICVAGNNAGIVSGADVMTVQVNCIDTPL